MVSIADLHGALPGLRGLAPIPECDVLLIAGDFCAEFTRMWDPDIMRMRQTQWLMYEFAAWEQTVPAKHILITPGNHDWIMELPSGCRSRFFIDDGCEIDGKKFWFTPWVSPIGSWNYLLPRDHRKAQFAMIPAGLDVLVSHGPAHKVLDRAYNGDDAGCPELRLAIYRAKPKFCVFGHIHEGQAHGNMAVLGDTVMRNVALWQIERWKPVKFDI